nr:carboxylesterase family protein [Paraburkholderia caribensis]
MEASRQQIRLPLLGVAVVKIDGIENDKKNERHDHGGFTRRDVLRIGAAAVTTSLFSLPGMTFARTGDSFKTVETTHGKLRGRVSDGLASYLGVRYGASTGGENRFLPPQPVMPWHGVRDALHLGSQSPQDNQDFATWVDPSSATEDCLMLNVFSPSSASTSSRLPVMVWLHGGGYSFGSGYSHVYNCGSIAKTGNVVTVGINHRLNIFGYTYLGDQQDDRFSSSGNAGHLDLIAALKWVRDNIENFGGDPNNVTVFGQSGGGGKITTLLGMPGAEGLFHKAIIQSGSVLKVRESSEAAALTDSVYATLGLRRGDIKALQAVPTQKLLKCFEKVSTEAKSNFNPSIIFGPTVDGRVLPKMIWKGDVPGFARKVPVLLGNTSQETAAFIGSDMFAPLKDDQTLAEKAAKFATINNIDVNALLPVIKKYRQVMPKLSEPELLVRVSTDIGFWKNAVTQADMLVAAKGSPVYMYECDWQTPCFDSKWALHGVELPFVFNVPLYGTAWDGKDSDALRASADPENHRLALGKQMFDAWTSFARSGNPSTTSLPWPTYDTESRATMMFNTQSKVENDPHQAMRGDIVSL